MTKQPKWFEDFAPVEGIVTRIEGGQRLGSFTIDFDTLAKVTNDHIEFLNKVKAFWGKEHTVVRNVAVYRSFSERLNPEKEEHITMVFDVVDSYIQIISCNTDHINKKTFVMEQGLNKSYVAQMETLL